MNGDGIGLTSVNGSRSFFDVDSDGFLEQTAWVTGGDGFLALDKNGNGSIDDARELFGTGETDGFAVLAQYDSDNNGKIDDRDEIFTSLRVWHDSNGDGVGELTTLADQGITSIGLSSISGVYSIHGNAVLKQGIFTCTDGSVGEISAIALSANQANSVATGVLKGVIVTQTMMEEVMHLPGLRGYGTVIDLPWALLKDDSLRVMVRDFVAMQQKEADFPSLKDAFKGIIFRWTGVDGVDPSSRGSNIDARILTALEHLWGQNWYDFDHNTANPLSNAVPGLVDVWEQVFNAFFSRVLLQTQFADVAPQATYDYWKDSWTLNVSAEQLFSGLATHAPTDLGGAIKFWTEVLPLFDGFRSQLSPTEGAYDEARRVALNYWGLGENIDNLLQGRLHAYAGSDTSDTIVGSSAVDILFGGHGNDSLQGGTDNDTYIYRRGDGDDIIVESCWNGDSDRLVLNGIKSSDVTLVRNGNDVTLVVAPTTAGGNDGGSILLARELEEWGGQGIDRVVFADRVVWNQNDLRRLVLAQAATAGNDVIAGFNVDDTLSGAGGNDTLSGGQGNDTYRFSRGDGDDIIVESCWNGDGDRLVLNGIDSSDVTLVRNGNDVTLVVAPTSAGGNDGGSVRLVNELEEWAGQGVDRVVFADGVVWNQNDLRRLVLAQAATAGNDVIAGFNVDDTLSGAGGNDTLSGGQGNDTYRFNLGDGHDTILEGYWDGGGDRLVLGAGLTADKLILQRSASDLNDVTLRFAGVEDSIFLDNEFAGAGSGVEQIQFADGTVWTRDQLFAHLPTAISVGTTVTGSLSSATSPAYYSVTLVAGITYVVSQQAGMGALADPAFQGMYDPLGHLVPGSDSNSGSADVQLTMTPTTTGTYTLAVGGSGATESFTLAVTAPLAVGGKVVGDIYASGVTNTFTVELAAGTTYVITQQGSGHGGGTNNDPYFRGIYDASGNLIANTESDDCDGRDSRVTFTANTSGTYTLVAGGYGSNTGTYTLAISGTVYGTTANDTLTGGAGNQTLTGRGGEDRYVFHLGDGQDVVDNRGFASDGDAVAFGSGIAADQLWFQRSDRDLTVTVIGTTDRLTIAGWYDGGGNHVARFETANGNMLGDTDVEKLVNAMAAFSPPPSGQTTLAADVHQQLDAVLAANWKAA
ncbi:MAG TPA: calcium-binding protein [Magnetospirillum sp.]|nr:calcium-binding protein [Magnetospirillum sp.]